MQINEPSWIVAELNNREVNCAYRQLLLYAEDAAFTIAERRKVLEQHLRTYEDKSEFTQNLRLRCEAKLLPDKELEWLDRDNTRLMRWLMHDWLHISSPSPIPPTQKVLGGEPEYYDHFLEALDGWNEDLQRKRSELSRIKLAWSKKLEEDKQLAWLDKHNSSQIEWAWKYLKLNLPSYIDISQYSPINTKEMYIDIFSVFDTWYGNTTPLYRLQVSMKQAWAQQKYRTNLKNEKKQQSTYVLSTEAKLQLKTLAKKNNVNLNQMLEHIIDQAFKNSKKDKSE